MSREESHIIKGIRLGRESAYEQLFNKYYRPLAVFALKYVLDLETAKEIVQDLFVHIFETRRSIIISTSLESYVYQSVRNRCLNHIRQTKTNREHLDNYKTEKETHEDMEARISETELEHKIFQIVSGLAPQCRKIFMMSRVKGISNSQIADDLNISKRTVETQISNALKVLRQHLN